MVKKKVIIFIKPNHMIYLHNIFIDACVLHYCLYVLV